MESELSSLPASECPHCSDIPLDLMAEQDRSRANMWEHVLSLAQASKTMSQGCLLLVRLAGRNVLGALASTAPREKKLSLWGLTDVQVRKGLQACWLD